MAAACGVLSIFIREPEFQGQTKEKLSSPDAQRLVENVVRDHFDHWLAEHPQEADQLLGFFFSWSGDRRDLHSFPTRRSSDLSGRDAWKVAPQGAWCAKESSSTIDRGVTRSRTDKPLPSDTCTSSGRALIFSPSSVRSDVRPEIGRAHV